jgi:hypothetical protein
VGLSSLESQVLFNTSPQSGHAIVLLAIALARWDREEKKSRANPLARVFPRSQGRGR